MTDRVVKVMVVDDTAVYRKIVSDLLADVPGVEVVGTAANGRLALDKIGRLQPDLLTLDLEMPEVDGLEVLRCLRQDRSHVKAIMLSALTSQGAQATMDALHLGAFDFVAKPTTSDLHESTKLLQRDLLAKVSAFRGTLKPAKAAAGQPPVAAPVVLIPAATPAGPEPTSRLQATHGKVDVVAIGVSTGGPKALLQVIPALPADLGVPVLIVQHMPPMFTRSLAESLDARSALQVMEATDGQGVEAGTAYIAPGGTQMKVVREGTRVVIRITDDAPEQACKPSADYLFRSVAGVYGGGALGVIMTGMGSDGTLGCRLLKRRQATILTQRSDTCVVYGMPRAVVEAGASDAAIPLSGLAAAIRSLVCKEAATCK